MAVEKIQTADMMILVERVMVVPTAALSYSDIWKAQEQEKRDDQAAAMRAQAIAERKLKRDGQAAAMREQPGDRRSRKREAIRQLQCETARRSREEMLKRDGSGGCNARRLGDYRSRKR